MNETTGEQATCLANFRIIDTHRVLRQRGHSAICCNASCPVAADIDTSQSVLLQLQQGDLTLLLDPLLDRRLSRPQPSHSLLRGRLSNAHSLLRTLSNGAVQDSSISFTSGLLHANSSNVRCYAMTPLLSLILTPNKCWLHSLGFGFQEGFPGPPDYPIGSCLAVLRAQPQRKSSNRNASSACPISALSCILRLAVDSNLHIPSRP